MNTSATVDVPDLRERLGPIRSEIGSDGSLAVFVWVTTSYETGRYPGTLSDITPLEISGSSYAIDPLALEITESTQATRRVVLPSRDPLAFLLPAGAGAFALLLAGVVWFNYRRLPGPGRLADRLHRSRYAGWMSAGDLPASLDGQRVEVESLEDFVGVAIDSKKRVLFDRSRNVYAVVDGGTIYRYGDTDWRDDGGFVWATADD